MEITNARITSTMLGYEDHGIPTCMLGLDYGGTHQGFGGYDLRCHDITFIMRILDAVGVRAWEDLKGKYVRVKADRCIIHAIGHICEDRWFCPVNEKSTGETL